MSRGASLAILSLLVSCSLAPAVAPHVVAGSTGPNPAVVRAPQSAVRPAPVPVPDEEAARQSVIEHRLDQIQGEVDKVKRDFKKRARVPVDFDKND
jgi:hypothetical protein